MPPKKSPLDKIKARMKAKNAENRIVMPGSAFEKLSESNAQLAPRPAIASDSEPSPSRKSVASAAKPTGVTKSKKATTSRKPAVKKEEAPKEIESWQPAGGELGVEGKTKPTAVLGIARIATWREKEFKEELQEFLDTCDHSNDVEAVYHYTFDLGGGEKTSDIYVRFNSKTAAAITKQTIDGTLFLERKLRIYYGAE